MCVKGKQVPSVCKQNVFECVTCGSLELSVIAGIAFILVGDWAGVLFWYCCGVVFESSLLCKNIVLFVCFVSLPKSLKLEVQ